VFILALNIYSNGQGINNLWNMGYSENGLEFGGSDINFISNRPDTFRVHRQISFRFANANISDSTGQLLFSTNGFDVADRYSNAMPNGHGLFGSGNLTGWDRSGSSEFQGVIILPDPGNSEHFYIYHVLSELYMNFPSGAAEFPEDLYCTEVDMTLNGGLGDVVNRNTVILHDTLHTGQLAACKHANGRDWWLIVPDFARGNYYRFLLTPAGLQLIGTQQIGLHLRSAGQTAFSPDGNYYAYFNSSSGMEVFNFDRCSGTFSNPQYIAHIDTMQNAIGLAFSPDSKKIYIATGIFIHQLNLEDSSLAASDKVVGIWDGFFDRYPFGTMFGLLKLAPDGKIYVSTGNGTRYLHCIEDPDIIGVGCNLVQRAVKLPTWNFNSFPNHPNYFLGPIAGSVCDTVTKVTAYEIRKNSIKTFPNPAPGNSFVTIQYPTLEKSGAKLQLYDVNGKLILEESLPPWSQVHNLRMPVSAEGMLILRVFTDKYESSGKIFVLPVQ
jgi:hypothetical protein